jgi:hypothetical protein
MANLKICRKCSNGLEFYPALLDHTDKKVCGTQVWCILSAIYIEWDSEVPEKCPYRMEHIVSQDAISDLADESIEMKESK